MSNRKVMIVVALILGIAGYWIADGGLSDLTKARSFREWIKTEGVVLSSEIAGERAPHPEIVYSYMVSDSFISGQTTMDVAGFGTKAARRDEAAKIVAKYSPGETVQVFYNPMDSSESTLRPFPVWSAYTRLGSGIFLMIGGVFMVGLMLRKRSVSPEVTEAK